MSLGPEEYPEEYLPPETPRDNRAVMPGIFLIIVAVLNLLMGGVAFLFAFAYSHMPLAELQKAYDEVQKDQSQRDALKQFHIENAEQLRAVCVNWGNGFGVVWALAGLLVLLGGIAMCTGKARGLAIFGAIVALLPLVSPMACPCIFGIAVGIWALVVLFRSNPSATYR